MYRWVEHTSEMELSIDAESAEAILEDATRALGELLSDAPPGERGERQLRVSAVDLPALLAEWLGELAYLSETEGFIPEHAKEVEVTGTTAKGVISGRSSAPQSLVKGVTYHQLEMDRADGAWRGRVVLDV